METTETKKKVEIPKAVFHKARGYKGVRFLETRAHSTDGKPMKTFYIRYRDPSGKPHDEKLPPTVTKASDASLERARRIKGDELPNVVRRKEATKAQEAEATRWTFDKLWEAWKRDPEQGHKEREDGTLDLTVGKKGSLKADLRFRKHLHDRFGDREPKDLTSDDLDAFRLDLAGGYSRETTKSIISLVSRIARYGSSRGYCPGLSFPIILRGKKLGKEARKKRPPNAAEYAAFLVACDTWPDRQAGNFQKFIALTGIRRGSVRDLKRGDVDFANKTVLLRGSKTGDVKIALSDNAVALLREHLDLPRNLSNPFVFTGSDEDGGRSLGQINRVPRKIADAAGLPADLDPCHAFRRFLATRLKRYGTKIGMKAGGWKSPTMLLHYQSAEEEEVRDALNEADERIAEKNGIA